VESQPAAAAFTRGQLALAHLALAAPTGFAASLLLTRVVRSPRIYEVR